MKITHDIIAAVTGPGWKYGLSRILINEDNEGVIFVAGQDEPYATFTATSVSTGRGKGETEEGEIAWRRRGSSCQYKLAKCKVSTATMTERWENSLTTGEDEPSGQRQASEDEVPTGSAQVVKDWVGDDAERAQRALEVENEGQQRVGLTKDLQNLIDAQAIL